MTLRVAFLGAGQMARHHVRAIRSLADRATIVGVHDPMPGRAAEFAALAGCPSFPSREALLAEARPDIVHICTPPGAHFDAAAAALEGGAHVYVEKPFALTVADARAVLDVARARRRLVCAGHQLLHDCAFDRLLAGAASLGSLVQVDSHFAFRPMGASTARLTPATLARQLVDVLPHPLYSLVAVLERSAPAGQPVELAWAQADSSDLQAVLRAGDVTGRLSVSLRARPVASSLTLTGTAGSLTCDFVRSIVVGGGNSGTEALEKVFNPVVEGAQAASRTLASVGKRVLSGASYPGLAELIDAFYRAVATGRPSPVSPDHLLVVTEIFEALTARIHEATRRRMQSRPVSRQMGAPLVVVTGAHGFLGTEVARALPRVRAVSRVSDADHTGQEWVVADLSAGLGSEALSGAEVVVHAAAETSGGYDDHQRNTLDATRHLLRAMHAANVRRLVHVSSLSVIRPPRTPWEHQDELTPRPSDARPLGAYTWGKCLQEELVEREAAALGIAVRVVRPGALIDWREPALPGLMGRRLFDRWHLGLGRPGLPIAICDVDQCARAIAWCATHFDDAPPVVNLLDRTIATRGDLIARLRSDGWSGRMIWVPISVVAAGLMAARAALSLGRGRLPARMAAWSILRPRRYDGALAAALLDAVRREADHLRVAAAPDPMPGRIREPQTVQQETAGTR